MSWADHFNTYQDACDFYGCDGPRELAYEAKYEAEESAIQTQDEMEARGGPLPPFIPIYLRDADVWPKREYRNDLMDDDIPF